MGRSGGSIHDPTGPPRRPPGLACADGPRRPSRLSAAELIDLVLDEGSWSSWDVPPAYGEISEAYAAELAAAREKSGVDESVLTGEGLMHGRRVAVVMGEFRLPGRLDRPGVGGPAGRGDRARDPRGPAAAGRPDQRRHPDAGGHAGVRADGADHRRRSRPTRPPALPYLVYLRHPTTGGVMASWGSLGHMTVAEPGALIGFLGPRVYEALYGKPFPEGVQTAENLYAHGIIDAVLPPEEIAGILDRALDDPARPAARHQPGARPGAAHPAPRRRDLGRRHPVAAAGPARRTTAAEVRRQRRDPAQRHGSGRARPRAAARAGAASGRRRASSSGRTGAARPPSTRWGRRRCARPSAGCSWPPTWGCRWSP